MPRKNNKLAVIKTEIKEKAIRLIAADISSDLKSYNSWQAQYWDPNPIMRSSKFTAEGGYAAFEAMDADARIYNAMTARKDSVVLRNWAMMSAIPGDPRQDFKAAFAFWVLDHIPYLSAKKKQILSDKDYGYSVTEKIFTRRDVVIPDKTVKRKGTEVTIKGGTIRNALIVTDLVNKPPTAFDFDRYGDMLMAVPNPNLFPALPGLWADGYMTGKFEYLDEEEIRHFMVSTHDPRHNSRKGWPLKATCFWDYIIKKATKIYRSIFAERYAMPIVKGTYATSDESEIVQFETRLKGIQKNSYIMTPEGFAVEFVEAIGKTGTLDIYQNILDYCDGNFSEVILGDREAAKKPADKEGSLKQEKLEADTTSLDALFNDDLIKQLIDLNFEYDGFYPYQVTNSRTAAAIDKILFQAQTFHNLGGDLSDSQLRELTGFRAPEDDEDTIPGVKGTAAGDNQASGNNPDNQLIADGTMKTKSTDPGEQFQPDKEQPAKSAD